MSKTEIMRSSAEVITIIIQREKMPATGALDTVKSNPPIIDDPSAHFCEYISYWFSMSVYFTLKYILGLSIFMSGGSKERKNCSLKGVYVAIFSLFENFESYN